MACVDCGLDVPIENKDVGTCATCGAARRKSEKLAARPPKEVKPLRQTSPQKPIAKRSKKMTDEMALYVKEKDEWLVGKMCAVDSDSPATEVHHKMGRVGYADQWARDNNITLLRDKRFWLAVSREGHIQIEMNPAWAKEMGFSLSRLAIIDDTPEYRTI